MAEISSELKDSIDKYIRLLNKEIRIEKVILFGSHAKGSNSIYSDIDIAIVSDDFVGKSFIEVMAKLLEKACELKIDIQAQPFTLDEYNKAEGLMEEIRRTGIELKIA